jgi:hypothetical protein
MDRPRANKRQNHECGEHHQSRQRRDHRGVDIDDLGVVSV